MKNPKSEYRNPKQITNAKLQIQKGLVWNIGILQLLCLFRISCLEFRISFSPLTEELSCQFAHNFIDKRLTTRVAFSPNSELNYSELINRSGTWPLRDSQNSSNPPYPPFSKGGEGGLSADNIKFPSYQHVGFSLALSA